MSNDGVSRLAYLYLVREVEDFLYEEAEIIDSRRYLEWLKLFAEDIRYWMPMRKNMSFTSQDLDITGTDDVAWVDDDKVTLTKRVEQIRTGVHWAEEPLSRVSHFISNVRLPSPRAEVGEGEVIDVQANVLIHRNRLETETDILAGRRYDRLRRAGESFQIAERKFVIDQSVLLAKNLTFFF